MSSSRNGCHPEKFLYSKKKKKLGLNRIGEGSYGQVSRGCTNKKCVDQIAVKMSKDDMREEFRISQLAHNIAPDNVPEPYDFVRCKPVGSIMYYQYIPSKNLHDYRKMTKKIFHTILKIIYKLNKYGIHHNDLHLGNILIEDETLTPYIIDFGMAETSQYTRDSRYDCHLFMNLVYSRLREAGIRSFIRKVIPREYLGKDTTMVKRYRLRNFDTYPGLPSLRSILTDPYFKK